MKDRKRIILDTDPGIDDALALILSLNSLELKIEAITTVSGNVPVSLATRNVFRILDLMNLEELPVIAEGSANPIKSEPQHAFHIHGRDGLGDFSLFEKNNKPSEKGFARCRAEEVLLELIDQSPDEITVVTLGPLTNIALAMQKDRKKMKKAKELIIMGGAVNVRGNITPDAEFNMFSDPHAARIVFDSKVPITLVGLDVTSQCILKKEEIKTGPKRDSLKDFILNATKRYMQAYLKKTGTAFCYLHDPLAVAVAIDPTLVESEAMDIGVSVDEKRGKTFCKKKNPRSNTKVCVEVDCQRFMSLFLERVFL